MFLYEEAIGSLRWTSVICTTVVCCQCSVFFHAKATASSFQWQWVEQGNYSIWAFPIASKKRKSAPIWNRRYKIFRNSVVKVFKSDSFFFFFKKWYIQDAEVKLMKSWSLFIWYQWSLFFDINHWVVFLFHKMVKLCVRRAVRKTEKSHNFDDDQRRMSASK